MQDNIYSKEQVIAGINKTVDVIKPTYGPAGYNVIVEEFLYPFHRITNDGKTIVEKIKLADPVENIGANIIKEAGDKADKDSGDGRKTTMILTQAILEGALKHEGDIEPIAFKQQMNDILPTVFKMLDEAKREISIEDIKHVATISSESEEIGQLISDIYKEIGKDGIIEVDASGLPESFMEVTEGVRIKARYFGEYSQTEPGKAIIKNPKILISKEKITSVDQLEPLLTAMVQAGMNELVIYCEDIDLSVASKLALTHLQGGFKTLLIKSPTLWKDWLFEDFAKITGATPVDSKEGKTFKTLSLTDLGTCEKIISTRDETRVIGIKDITEHLATIKDELRKAWLQTKVGVLKVGASSETELGYIKKKATDGCAASHLALKEGVVDGAGVALYRVATELNTPNVDFGTGVLLKALVTPHLQLIKNMGLKVGEKDFGSEVIDPLIVVKNAVRNAVSIASTVLTSNGVIIVPKQENENTKQMPIM